MKPIKAIVVGFGDRGQIYSKFALQNPELLEIIGVVDPNPVKREKAKKLYNIKDDMCFEYPDALYENTPLADAIINATMDRLHVETTIPLLKAGYDILLEKPIANNVKDLMKLKEVAHQYNRKLVVCHVLRYAPFYVKIKQLILNGEIGDLISIEANEHVGIAHMLSSYVRGKWNNEKTTGSSLLMAKSCHDLDLFCWLNSSSEPKEVVSLATRSTFIPERAPNGAGTRCMVDCQVEENCPYSCKNLYIDHNAFPHLIWDNINGKDYLDVTMEEKVESLKTDNPHGRCAYKVESDLIDQQSVMIKFENNTTANFNLVGGVPKSGRRIHIIGTKGEIEGYLKEKEFTLRKYNVHALKIETELIKITEEISDPHGGGDMRIVEDFIRTLRDEEKSISSTTIEDSINGHLCGLGAERSRKEGTIIQLVDLT